MKVSYWKFVKHEVSTTREQAAAFAKNIEDGVVTPHNAHGERYYKLGGWCYDVGRKPYLIEYAHGGFERKWARSVSELRNACYLRRADKVIQDPFFTAEEDDIAA